MNFFLNFSLDSPLNWNAMILLQGTCDTESQHFMDTRSDVMYKIGEAVQNTRKDPPVL